MKICKRCFREFDEEEFLHADISPATELADITLQDIGVEDINELCPDCREELGVMDLLGFGNKGKYTVQLCTVQTAFNNLSRSAYPKLCIC